MRKFHIFSEISILGLIFEIFLIAFVFFSLGYISNKVDPLLINSPINVVLILVSVITLFYGLFSGVAIISFLGIALYYFYKPFPYDFFVNNLLFMLIFSEFHFFWNRTLKKLEKQNEYIQMKLTELTKNFYSLKISHDQLEKSYIIKPTSIRNIINQVKNIYLNNPLHAYEEILVVIAKNYGIRKTSIFIHNDGKYEHISSLVTNKELDLNSKVLNDALTTKTPSYLSKFENAKYDYLAVIPGYNANGELKTLITIEDMQFLQFNKDALFSISVILDYFSDYASKTETARDLILKHQACPSDFLIEIKRMAYLKKKLSIKSVISAIKVKNLSVDISDVVLAISKNLRGMDVICHKDNNIFILFPLVSYSNINGAMEKIENQIRKRFSLDSDSFGYRVIEIMPDAEKTAEYLIKIVKNGDK